ncbi:MAG: hypothetical protein K6F98_07555 [Bacteroidales bacterium]|nr:hypothetical protein [Bacteroidales bacterium]
MISYSSSEYVPETVNVAILSVFDETHKIGLLRIHKRNSVKVFGDRCCDIEIIFDFFANSHYFIIGDASIKNGKDGEWIDVSDTATIGVVFQVTDITLKVVVNPINERLSIVSVRQEFLG